MGVPHFIASLGVISANIRINYTSPETRRIVLPDTENRTIVCSLVWTKHRNVTDRQTDRVTDRRTDRHTCIFCSYYSGLHCEQCGGAVIVWFFGS